MEKALNLFIIILVVTVLSALVLFLTVTRPSRRDELLSAEEQQVEKKYDYIFPEVRLSLKPDMERQYGNGIYRVVFSSRGHSLDFSKLGYDSLKRLSDAVYKDIKPVIPGRELYDSLIVTFNTRYQSWDKEGYVLSDTLTYSFNKVFRYSLRPNDYDPKGQ